jgi:hypothetical protein
MKTYNLLPDFQQVENQNAFRAAPKLRLVEWTMFARCLPNVPKFSQK